MNKIDQFNLNNLTYTELSELNNRVVERMKYIRAVKCFENMSKFVVGQTICFDTDFETVTGVVMKLNQKTVTIYADDGHTYRVNPSFLRPVVDDSNTKNLKVIR